MATAQRLELNALLQDLTEHVYFQSPTTIRMQYPCIRYERDNSLPVFADNKLYAHTKRYQITVIDRNPDSELPDQVEALPFCAFDRFYAAEGLNHWVFHLFF